MRAVVIGIGSPHGDDAVGLHVAQRLASHELPANVEVLARDRPGLSLLDDLEAAAAAVLVDALRSGGRPGFVWRVPPAALSRGRIGSSHELRVADTLALAESLGRQLPPLRIVAVEVGTVRGEGLSPEVAAAVEEACAAALSALAELMPRA